MKATSTPRLSITAAAIAGAAHVLLLLGCLSSQGISGDEIVNRTDAFSLVGLLLDDKALNRAHDVDLWCDVAYVPGKGGSTGNWPKQIDGLLLE